MIDLLGRAGYLNRAVHLMRQLLPHETDFVLWNVILDACRKFGQLELARTAFEQTMHLDEPPVPLLSFEEAIQLKQSC
jgi:pentatricopeptide repeat protein